MFDYPRVRMDVELTKEMVSVHAMNHLDSIREALPAAIDKAIADCLEKNSLEKQVKAHCEKLIAEQIQKKFDYAVDSIIQQAAASAVAEQLETIYVALARARNKTND